MALETSAANYPQAQANSAETHQVENMPPLLEDYNLYQQDTLLQQCLSEFGADWAKANLAAYGAKLGSAQSIHNGIEANRIKPSLNTHNRYGKRIDEVEFHPAYHALMASSKAQGLTGEPWAQPRIGAHVKRAAGSYMAVQIEAGHGCPITMTFAAAPTLKKQPEIGKIWLPKTLACEYDPRNIPDSEKSSVTIGMAMTEKQGGSDVRQNSTKAYPINASGAGQAYELVGHKYFVSAPMCDAFLVLAQAKAGISCFLVPRWRPDNSKNPLQLIRLKDKMGNASNASSETELRGAFGWLIGEEGRGIANILDMVAMTRFDCLVASAGAMRQHMTQILHHTQHRQAFGKLLNQQPLMQNVLADLELETQASTLMAFRVAQALDQMATGDEQAASFMRLATPVGKYWGCKRQVGHAYEAMETIGGSAVMENSLMPRFYREAPINSIWEGSGNVQCLDALRAMQKDQNAWPAFRAELTLSQGLNKYYDAHLNKLDKLIKSAQDIEFNGRRIVEALALALQAGLMLRLGNDICASSFCYNRLHGNSGLTYGLLAQNQDCWAIFEPAIPR